MQAGDAGETPTADRARELGPDLETQAGEMQRPKGADPEGTLPHRLGGVKTAGQGKAEPAAQT